jgi:hypothetical protein
MKITERNKKFKFFYTISRFKLFLFLATLQSTLEMEQ